MTGGSGLVKSAALVSALLVVVACEREATRQSRLFTEDELATLETRVLAEVNKSRRDCIRPEGLALWKPTGELAACVKECDVLDYGADHKKPIRRDELWRIATPEASTLDAKCGALVSAAFERAAANPGCSPFQLGIENVEVTASLHSFHLLHLLARHALAQSDRVAAARSLVAALQASQDYARGRTSDYVVASALTTSSASQLIELLADAQLPRNELDALATSVDHLIASEPPPSERLQTEAADIGLEHGLVPLKGPSWPVPGGRTELMQSSLRPSTSHDARDDAGISMMYALEIGERFRAACQPTASVRECFDHLNATRPIPGAAPLATLLDRPRNDDAATRARVKREIVDAYLANESWTYLLLEQAQTIRPIVAVRLRIEILRNGRCPTAAELDAPPYTTLRAPSVLGDSIPVTMVDHALRVDVPAWVRDEIEEGCKEAKPPLAPCRLPKGINLVCP